MKKIIAIISLMLFYVISTAQVTLTFSPTSNDSVVGATTKYCTLSAPIKNQWVGSIEVYITPSISSSDSTHVWVEGSQNNSTWYRLNLGTPGLSVGTYYTANAVTTAAGYDYKGRMGTSAAGWLWNPNWFIAPPYLRVAVQHFKAATSVKITRATIYLKN
jgi:hypothetical protein